MLVLIRAAEFTLEPTSGWDTLGLRGTCSSGLHITGHVMSDDLFPVPFADIANGGGGQLRHILLSASGPAWPRRPWRRRTRPYARTARRAIGTTPQAALRLAEIFAEVQVARSTLAEAQRLVEAAVESDSLEDIRTIMSLRNVKVVTSKTAMSASAAMQICGINGFRREKTTGSNAFSVTPVAP